MIDRHREIFHACRKAVGRRLNAVLVELSDMRCRSLRDS
jgi:hypothetical protein